MSRQFWFLWTAAMSSSLGSTMAGLAYPLVVLGLTGSPGQAGLLAGYQAALGLAVAAPAGALVDRWDRRWVLIGSDAAMGSAAAGVAVASWTGRLSLAELYVVATVGAVGTAFAGPGRQAVLRSVVPPERFADAFAREEARSHGVSLIGPPIGGFLYTCGRFLPFVADAVSFFVSAACVLAARLGDHGAKAAARRTAADAAVPGVAAPDGPAAGRPRTRLRTELAEAARWLAAQRFLGAAVAFVLVVNLVTLATQLPVITLIRARGGSATTLGLVLAGAGVGGVLGASAAPRLARGRTPGSLLLTVGWILAVLTAALAIPFGRYWPGVVSALAALAIPAVNVALGTIVFTTTPPAMQGRISALLGMATMAAASAAPVLGGALAGRLGPATSLLALGGLLAAVCATATALPVLRSTAAPVPVAAMMARR